MHGLSPNWVSNDSRWTIFVAQSLLDRRDVNIDEYPEWMARYKYYSVECVAPEGRVIFPVAGASDCPTGSHYYSWYPVAVSVLAAPLVAVMRPILWIIPRALTDAPSKCRGRGRRIGTGRRKKNQPRLAVCLWISERRSGRRTSRR